MIYEFDTNSKDDQYIFLMVKDDQYRKEEKRSKEAFLIQSELKIVIGGMKRCGDDECGARLEEDHYWRDEKRSKRHVHDEFEPRSNGDHDRREDKKLERNGS